MLPCLQFTSIDQKADQSFNSCFHKVLFWDRLLFIPFSACGMIDVSITRQNYPCQKAKSIAERRELRSVFLREAV